MFRIDGFVMIQGNLKIEKAPTPGIFHPENRGMMIKKILTALMVGDIPLRLCKVF